MHVECTEEKSLAITIVIIIIIIKIIAKILANTMMRMFGISDS